VPYQDLKFPINQALEGLVIPRKCHSRIAENRSDLSYQGAPRHHNIQAALLFDLGTLT